MRSRWEAVSDDTQLDEPVTITQRQLRSLTRGARAGLFGILLAVIAIGLTAWNMFAGPGRFTEPKPVVAPAEATQGTPAENVSSAPATPHAQTAAVTPTATAAPARPAARLDEATPAKVVTRKRTATRAMKTEDIRTPITIPAPDVFPDSTR